VYELTALPIIQIVEGKPDKDAAGMMGGGGGGMGGGPYM
jgi:hypothetical protein